MLERGRDPSSPSGRLGSPRVGVCGTLTLGSWFWAGVMGVACWPPGQLQLPSQGSQAGGDSACTFTLTCCIRQALTRG